ncbi:MAG: hypothetical protein IKJ58_03180 [Akkermansia sp.]|nr:hypothetical protein [Akkermansia sp.]
MAKLSENPRNDNFYEEEWFNTLTPALRQFWHWMITSDGKKHGTARNYVDCVRECSSYVQRFLGYTADFYTLESSREVSQLKELLFSNPVFQLHCQPLNPRLISSPYIWRTRRERKAPRYSKTSHLFTCPL